MQLLILRASPCPFVVERLSGCLADDDDVAADPVRLHAVHRQTARVPQLAHSAAALLSPRSIVRRSKHPHAAAAGIHSLDFGLWSVRFPPVLVRTGRRLPVQALGRALGHP